MRIPGYLRSRREVRALHRAWARLSAGALRRVLRAWLSAIGFPVIGFPVIGFPAIGFPAIGFPAIVFSAIVFSAISFPAIASSAIAAPAAQASVPVSVTDDRGAAITLAQPAARIVTLAPHLTELVYAAGAGARLIAVPQYSDYPDAAKSLPQIGDATRVDLERVLALRPDLVLAWKSGNSAADVARLEGLGLRVYVSDAGRLTDVARVVRSIGRLAGTGPAAEQQAADFERRIAALRAPYSSAARLRVFYQIWDRPLLTINGEHIISDVLELCGAVNVFGHAALLTPAVSLEALMASRPDVVLGGSSALAPVEFAEQWRSHRVSALERLPVRYVPPDLIQRATLRIAEGAGVICETLQEVRAAALLR